MSFQTLSRLSGTAQFRKIHRSMFTSSTKRHIRWFHPVVVSWTSKKCLHVQNCCFTHRTNIAGHISAPVSFSFQTWGIKNCFAVIGRRLTMKFLHRLVSSRVYSWARPCGISAVWRKMPHKIYVAASNGGKKKNRPKDKYYFFFQIEHSKTSDNSTDLTAAPLSCF